MYTEDEFWLLEQSKREQYLVNQYKQLVKECKYRLRKKFFSLQPFDIENEVIFGLYKAEKLYKTEKGSFKGFAYTIIMRHVYDFAKSEINTSKNNVSYDHENSPIEPTVNTSFEDSLKNEDLIRKIQSALSHDTKARHIFNLYYIEKWSQKEIAKHLGIIPQGVSYHVTKIHDILKKSKSLKKYMKGEAWKRSKPAKKQLSINFRISKKGICCVEDCTKKSWQRGRCHKHYDQKYKIKKPRKKRPTPITDLQCPICSLKFTKPVWYIRRQLKSRSQITCSIACGYKLRSKNKEKLCLNPSNQENSLHPQLAMFQQPLTLEKGQSLLLSEN